MPVINAIYEHYKGGTYMVYFLAQNTTTKEDMVIYESLEHGSRHARPLKEWFEKVDSLLEPNKKVERFIYSDSLN